ncbi:MAG: hypothetical protein EHM41_18910 [Chloroflexi bacterium]|nr:MAG: hypothetical protein EHM41_18910 [Chloroflexota bacterium]
MNHREKQCKMIESVGNNSCYSGWNLPQGVRRVMVSIEDVIRIYQNLLTNDIQVWLTGGWGIDALLGEQTRPHKDLDLIVQLKDIVRIRELLSHDGYGLKEIWSENRWVLDPNGVETATAIVLQDAEGREVDLHAMTLNDEGQGIPAWYAEGFIFSRQDLAGRGTIAGIEVHCLTPEMQILTHRGYVLPEEHQRDLELLREKFGVKKGDYGRQ